MTGQPSEPLSREELQKMGTRTRQEPGVGPRFFTLRQEHQLLRDLYDARARIEGLERERDAYYKQIQEGVRAERELLRQVAMLWEALGKIGAPYGTMTVGKATRIAQEALASIADFGVAPFGREGMVTVWSHDGTYLGCMGAETWAKLVAKDAAAEALASSPAEGTEE